jgi:predicted kinase
MKKLILTIAASGSGKTTWAEEFIEQQEVRDTVLDQPVSYNNWRNLNRDDVRFELFCDGVRDWAQYKFKRSNENKVTGVIDKMAQEAVANNKNIIVSDTNLNPKIRNKWKEFAEKNGYEYEEKLFPCSWEELVKRNAQREGGLSESILWSQYKRYNEQFGEFEQYCDDPSLDQTIICDIDGTVADMKGIRKPFEWNKVGLDRPRYEIISMLEGLAFRTGHVTFLSGRDGICYDDTLEWIENNITNDWHEDIEWDLHMRNPNDKRKDDIVKYELYQKHIKGIYNVSAVLDDRRQMIRFWNLINMPNVIDVGKYNEEF